MPTDDAAARLPPVLRPERPPRRSLAELAERFDGELRGDADGVTLTGITLATADLRAGEAFVAIRGVNRHGAEFAEAAAAKGAVGDRDGCRGAGIAASSGLPLVVVDDPRGVLGALSAWVYGRGRTMTSRSCSAPRARTARPASRMCSRGSSQLGVTTGLSSTAERHIAGQVIVSRLTTPEASEMHALLALMRERGVEAVAVEVSAQALSRRRVDGSCSMWPRSPT